MAHYFSKSVFINCPFDDEYVSLLRPLLFTVIYLKYHPRIASERSDSGEVRFHKICELIEQSKFSIHDLSRIKSKEEEEYFRMNMPFELGVDIGCRRFRDDKLKHKKCLILEGEKYGCHKALSDLSGSDTKSHSNEPEKMVRVVRNWFIENGLAEADSGTRIWEKFNEFMTDFYKKRKEEGYSGEDLQVMPIPEYIGFISNWL